MYNRAGHQGGRGNLNPASKFKGILRSPESAAALSLSNAACIDSGVCRSKSAGAATATWRKYPPWFAKSPLTIFLHLLKHPSGIEHKEITDFTKMKK